MITLPPHFVEVTPEGWWTLADDDYIRRPIIEAKRLNWDDTFKDLPELDGRKGLALDIGAFIGDTVPWFTSRGFITYAFEPFPDAFICLQQNCYLTNLSRYVHPNDSSEICRHPGECQPPMCLAIGDGSPFRLGPNSKVNMGGRRLERDSTTAKTTRIDDLGLEHVAVMKIDVEGFEPLVLAGAAKTIKRDRPVIIIEINRPALALQDFVDGDILRHLRRYNKREIYRATPDQWDLICVPK